MPSPRPPQSPTVLLFTWFYLPFLGGSELFVQAVTRRLAHRFRFVIVTARRHRSLPRREDRPEATVLRVGLGAGADKLFYPAPALRAALSVKEVDLVHAVMVNAAALAAWTYLKVRPAPSLLTLQSGDSEEYVRRYMGPVYPLYRFLHRPFDRVHAISRHLRERALRFGADPSVVSVVPNGVDVERFERERLDAAELAALRARHGLEGRRAVVSVSRLALKNGLDTLIRGFARLAPAHADVSLLLVGDGEDRENLEALARELGVRDRVVFAGSVDPDETPRYLALASVFARPSVSEGLGNAFLEAMAAGLPVVATPVGGILDFVVDGENGLLCEVGRPESVAEALSRLLDEPELARRLGASGRELVAREYHWDAVAERIGDLYDELLAR